MELRKGKRYLQEYQLDYIKDNAEQLSQGQLAAAIGCSQATVSVYCKKLHIKARKSYFQFTPPVIPVCEKI